MGCALKLESYYENQQDWSFFEEKQRTEYVYDNNGNILSKSSKILGKSYAFEYNSRNQMKKAYVLSSPLSLPIKTITYNYDPVGRRNQRSVVDNVDSTKSYTRSYIYDGSNIVAEIDGNNRLLASYTHSPLSPDDLLAVHFTNHAVQNSNGGDAISDQYELSQAQGNYYYLKDHLNTVTDIINGQGNIVQSYDYSAFGVLRGIKDSSGSGVTFNSAPIRTHFTFTSREHEPETGLYYYRARYYDPSTGRFLQADPDPGKLGSPSTFLSKYIYGANNPVMLSDPSGRLIWFLAIPIMMAVAGAISGGIWAAFQPGANLGSILTGIGMGLVGGALVGAGAVAGLYLTALLGGATFATATVAAETLIGTSAGAIGAGLGAGLVSGFWGMSQNPLNPGAGFLTGFVFGFVAGAIGGAGYLSRPADVTQGTILNPPPIDQPALPPQQDIPLRPAY